MNKELIFKTNIKCGGCVATVTPHLNAVKGIDSWNVELDNADRLLHIFGEEVPTETIIEALKEAGYQAEPIKE